MRLSLLILFPLLAGCGPVFKLDASPTCDVGLFDWSGGLTRHVIQGNGSGEFDWAPPEPGVSRAAGAYDLKSGIIDYLVEYDPGHARVQDVVTGSGTLWPDGDLDVVLNITTTWTDGAQTTEQVRERRFGCELSERHEAGGSVWFLDGVYETAGLTYTREFAFGDQVIVAAGLRESSFGYAESAIFEGGGYELTFDETGDSNGVVTRELVDKFDDVTVRGGWTRQLSGETSYDYKVNDKLGRVDDWAFTLDLGGSGVGTVDVDGNLCDLDLTAFACEKSGCGKDYNGACTIPLVEPRR